MHPFLKHRTAAGLSQAALGQRLGISQVTVAHYERGKRRISAERAIEYERLLGGAVTRYQMRPDIFGPAPAVTKAEAA